MASTSTTKPAAATKPNTTNAAKYAAKVVQGAPLTVPQAWALYQQGTPRSQLTPRVAGVLYLRRQFVRLCGGTGTGANCPAYLQGVAAHTKARLALGAAAVPAPATGK